MQRKSTLLEPEVPFPWLDLGTLDPGGMVLHLFSFVLSFQGHDSLLWEFWSHINKNLIPYLIESQCEDRRRWHEVNA